MATWLAFAVAALLAFAVPAFAGPTPDEFVSKADFDFYVVTLSWSPGFCDTGGEGKSPEQCAAGSGQGFVLHGLWPDNSDRPDPSDCDSSFGRISDETLAKVQGLYPSNGLAVHEWISHGRCTGLSPENYFGAAKFARDEFTIPNALKHPTERQSTSPRAIEKAFIDANANLTPASMAVTCGHGELIDVRFCLTRNLQAFAICPKVSGHTCYSSQINVSPVR